MNSRERKYHQEKKFEAVLDKVLKDYPTAGTYDGIKMKRFWQDEFSLWDTGQPIMLNGGEWFKKVKAEIQPKLKPSIED